MLISIKNANDRRTVASILVENGYRVDIVKIKDGKKTETKLRATTSAEEADEYMERLKSGKSI